MWKCSPTGSSTRNANTVSICSQYDSCQPARSVPSGRPANVDASAEPTTAKLRS